MLLYLLNERGLYMEYQNELFSFLHPDKNDEPLYEPESNKTRA